MYWICRLSAAPVPMSACLICMGVLAVFESPVCAGDERCATCCAGMADFALLPK